MLQQARIKGVGLPGNNRIQSLQGRPGIRLLHQAMSRRLIYNGPAWAYRNVRASLVVKPSRNLQTASDRARSQQSDGLLWGACAMQNSHCGLSSAGGAATSLRSTRQRARRPFGLSRWSETAAAPCFPACQFQQRHLSTRLSREWLPCRSFPAETGARRSGMVRQTGWGSPFRRS